MAFLFLMGDSQSVARSSDSVGFSVLARSLSMGDSSSDGSLLLRWVTLLQWLAFWPGRLVSSWLAPRFWVSLQYWLACRFLAISRTMARSRFFDFSCFMGSLS